MAKPAREINPAFNGRVIQAKTPAVVVADDFAFGFEQPKARQSNLRQRTGDSEITRHTPYRTARAGAFRKYPAAARRAQRDQNRVATTSDPVRSHF